MANVHFLAANIVYVPFLARMVKPKGVTDRGTAMLTQLGQTAGSLLTRLEMVGGRPEEYFLNNKRNT